MNLRTRLTGTALALSLMLAAGTAGADDFDFGVIAPGTTESRVTAHSPGSFTDNFTFQITQAGPDGEYSYVNFLVPVFSNISNAMLRITGPVGFTTFETALPTNGQFGIAFASGSYNARVTGTADGQGGGAYEFNIQAPTPEPAVWLTMIAGAGMVGFGLRRRKRAARTGALATA